MTATVSTASFEGSDVDGLDHLAQDCTTAAEVVNAVKAVCEAIVAAASIFGPFGAAFIAYLKTVVIPWLTKIAEALQLFAKVLSARSSMQRNASSTATSLPTYTTPTNLPTQSTSNYPTLPVQAGTTGTSTSSGVAPVSASGSGSTVTTPPAIGATSVAGTTGTTTATGSTTASTDPIVQEITALTGLVTAVDHLLHPTSPTGTTTTPITTTPITTTPTTPPTTTPTPPITTAPITGTDPTGGLGGLTGAVTPTGTAPNGDVVGTLQIPVEVSPDGKITPLLHTGDPSVPTAASTVTSPATPAAALTAAHSATPAITHQPATVGGSTHALTHSADSGTSGSSGGGGSFGGASSTPAAVSHTAPAVVHHAAASVAHHVSTAPHAAAARPATHAATTTHAGSNHDGLYSGLGQATGLGAGAGAIAKASLHEASQHAADGGLIGATALPFDAASDGGAQSAVYSGVLGQ